MRLSHRTVAALALVGGVLALVSPATAQPLLLFVDADATGNDNGMGWAHAYTDLQAALQAATAGDEIWVAAGTYLPDQGTGDRTATFQLVDGVTIYGGFPTGGGDGTFAARDPTANETILSGDLDGDDEAASGGPDENSYHVVTGNGVGATLDGFVITAGNADGAGQDDRGAGIYNDGGSPTISNCIVRANAATTGAGMYNNGAPTLSDCQFTNNTAAADGGGLYNAAASTPTLTGCTFTDNDAAGDGGAVYNNASNSTFTDCTFTSNDAVQTGGAMQNVGASPQLTRCTLAGNSANLGGGMLNDAASNPALTHCILRANDAAADGGGVYNQSSSPTLTNCLLAGNTAGGSGGAVFNFANSNPALTNCTLSLNTADNGGGVLTASGDPTLTNCILWGNTDSSGDTQGAQLAGSTGDVTFCCIEGLVASGVFDSGMNTDNIGDDPMFVDADGADGSAGTVDDNVRLLAGSPCIDTGDNASAMGIATDLDDRPRIAPAAGVVDMGAFEFRAPLFVDASATGADNGSSWTNAFVELQSALNAAAMSGRTVSEIWVADGTYHPDFDVNAATHTGMRDATFQLVDGVAVYGGFAGGEVSRAERNPTANTTTLSGDIGNPGDTTDNSFHVVSTDNTVIDAAGTVLEGVVITGGVADGAAADTRGAGLYNNGGSPTLINCILRDNQTAVPGGSGGGVQNENGGVLTFVNCLFIDNQAEQGGALHNVNSNATLINCTVGDNEAAGANGEAGGIFSDGASAVTLTNCILFNNTDSSGPTQDAQLTGGTAAVTFCCIQGLVGGGLFDSGTNQDNIGDDPLFADLDLRLATGSPCVDAGDNDAVPADAADLDQDGDSAEPTPIDLDGNLRIAGAAPAVVDMGAYEFASSPAGDGSGGGNQDPVADAGDPQTVTDDDGDEKESVTLDGSGSSDPDGDALTFVWTEGNTQLATGEKPTVSLAVGTHTITLTVTDDDGATDTDTVVIIVEPGNQAPTAVASASPSNPVEGSTVTLRGTDSSDPDGDTLAFRWARTAGGAVALSGQTSATATFVAPEVGPAGETLTFRLTVDDGNGKTDTDTVTVTVRESAGNGVPTAVATADPADVGAGETVTLTATQSSDPDDDALTFLWEGIDGPAVELSGADTAQATFVAPALETLQILTFRLTVDDGRGGADVTTIQVIVQASLTAAPAGGAAPTDAVSLPMCGACASMGVVSYFGLLFGWLGLRFHQRRRFP